MIDEIIKELKKRASGEKAKNLIRFFKTGKGDYGEGDKFIGLTNPQVREVVKRYVNISVNELDPLIKSEIHEFRLTALLILVSQYKKGDKSKKKKIFDFYLENIKSVNNWDLVDLTAPHIIGAYLFDKNRDLLYDFAKTDNLWLKRIAIISTFYFIRKNEFRDTLSISEILLNDKRDLINKAVGWMLREIGKRDLKTEENFLIKRYKYMPRTMLRYAIEKFPEDKRQKYLKGEI
jgi:3-methyladenine DNA glycosylase AlkD